MRPEDLTKLRVAGDPRLDATGSRVAFVVSGMDAEQNRSTHSIWLAGLDQSGEPRPLTALDGLALARAGHPMDHSSLPVRAQRRTTASPADTCSPRSPNTDEPRRGSHGARMVPDRREPRRVTTVSYRLDGEGWTFDSEGFKMRVRAWTLTGCTSSLLALLRDGAI
jgi:dipeptidyl aminopeptidase/acylaminoacyl peptidase